MALTIKFQPYKKKLDQKVKYKPSSFTVESEEAAVNFQIELLAEEVKKATKKEKKKLLNVTKQYYATMTPFFLFATKSQAASVTTASSGVGLGATEVGKVFIQYLPEILALALVSAILGMMAVGFMRMIGKKELAVKFTDNIIKGFITVLIATPLMLLIYCISIWIISTLNIPTIPM